MKTALAAVLAAVVASACCIGPVALVLLGAGAFYVAYRPMSDSDKCSPASRTRTRMGVWFAAALAVALVTFPYYIGYLV